MCHVYVFFSSRSTQRSRKIRKHHHKSIRQWHRHVDVLESRRHDVCWRQAASQLPVTGESVAVLRFGESYLSWPGLSEVVPFAGITGGPLRHFRYIPFFFLSTINHITLWHHDFQEIHIVYSVFIHITQLCTVLVAVQSCTSMYYFV